MINVQDRERVAEVSADIHCGYFLTRDLLVLAGGDELLVYDACNARRGIESVKAYIIDKRISKIDKSE